METLVANLGKARRFNSATAVMPWKPMSWFKNAIADLGFNSATAVMPWKLDELKSARTNHAALQFGHGGDAVETKDALASISTDFKLQFGHGGDAVETGESEAKCAHACLVRSRERLAASRGNRGGSSRSSLQDSLH